MLEVSVTEEFEKRYAELPLSIQKKAERQETFFKTNPFHPSLNTEKLNPKNRECWSFRKENSLASVRAVEDV